LLPVTSKFTKITNWMDRLVVRNWS